MIGCLHRGLTILSYDTKLQNFPFHTFFYHCTSLILATLGDESFNMTLYVSRLIIFIVLSLNGWQSKIDEGFCVFIQFLQAGFVIVPYINSQLFLFVFLTIRLTI